MSEEGPTVQVAGKPDDEAERRFEVALAEYSALRSEILSRSQTQQAMTGLAVTIFGVAAAAALDGKHEAMVVLPIVTIMLGLAHLGQTRGIRRIASYIATELDRAAPGLSHWEIHVRNRSFLRRAGASVPYVFVFALGPLGADFYVLSTEEVADEGWWVAAAAAMTLLYALVALSDELQR